MGRDGTVIVKINGSREEIREILQRLKNDELVVNYAEYNFIGKEGSTVSVKRNVLMYDTRNGSADLDNWIRVAEKYEHLEFFVMWGGEEECGASYFKDGKQLEHCFRGWGHNWRYKAIDDGEINYPKGWDTMFDYMKKNKNKRIFIDHPDTPEYRWE